LAEKFTVADAIVDKTYDDKGSKVTEGSQPSSSSTGLDYNPAEQEGRIEMVAEVNDAYADDADIPSVDSIVKMKWRKGKLKLKVAFDTEEKIWMDFEDMKVDMPILTAEFIVRNHHPKEGEKPCNEYAWAKKTVEDFEKSAWRLKRIHGDVPNVLAL
jgi:hypothetical protein